MVKENERLRQLLYYRDTTRKKTYSSSNPRHMTSTENLNELAEAEWRQGWKAMLKEAGKILKARRKAIDDAEKEAALEVRMAEQASKRAEREAEKQRRDTEKEVEKEKKKKEREAKAAEKAAEKVKRAEEIAAAKVRAQVHIRGRGGGRKRVTRRAVTETHIDDDADSDQGLATVAFDEEWKRIRMIVYIAPEEPQPPPAHHQPNPTSLRNNNDAQAEPPTVEAADPPLINLEDVGARRYPRRKTHK
ncbi:hypothetical protein JR316_0011799 [Psilocybe cubensis]|uniref:Uncharacterized protein n=2 Tax=Psilocybe cubensis TaxID=181762 RepID=A0A8H7XMP6_PSICU|nr:hypothetical protein JR316_0011799 [Psilocybe cubensis]KAH9476228.1 hypothetical protein JR316_0011799 [Psilocybe cubensis]